jgi:cyclopropane fatty-acyl-phospholipid synthase-like methyltransferase
MACHSKKHDHKHNEEHAHQHGHNEANQHMHKHDVKDLAKSFDNPERAAWQKPDEVIALFGDLKGKKIMDIGAGSGYFSFRLAEKGADVIAADVNDDFQEFISKKKKELNYSDNQVQTRKVPFDSPNLEEAEVDGVIIVNTYHHIEDRTAYFSKVLTGLKKDGVLMVVDFFKKEFKEDVPGPPIEMKLAKEQVISELEKAGFSSFETNTSLLKYQYIILAKK